MKQNEYNETFKTKEEDSTLLRSAFEQVADIRKFEIELYWKRATYFWALIAVAFAGHFAILASEQMPNKYFLSLVVASVGFVFTFAWYLVNRGSKYWQENWENHLDLLEDKITGPLYKTLLERPKNSGVIEKFVTGPLSVSVSKINQWVSVFVGLIGVILVAFSLCKSLGLRMHCIKLLPYFIVISIMIFSCIFMFLYGKTHTGKHTPKVVSRETEII